LRAVLAHAPTDVLDPTRSQRLLQQASGGSKLSVSRRKELREAPPHNLAGRIPRKALRARVPRSDGAVGFEQIDRVVLDGLDEDPEVIVGQLHGRSGYSHDRRKGVRAPSSRSLQV